MYHQVATIGQLGKMTPFLMQEVAPGDRWSGKVGALIRMSPMKKALLHDIFVDLFVFYVPHRLVYANWEEFIAEGPASVPTYTLPTVSVGAGSSSYMSLFMQANGVSATTYSALRLYAFNLIFNEFFRDDEQALRNPTDSPGSSGVQVNFKRDYWSELQAQIATADAEHYAPVAASLVSAKDILDAIARQKVSMKRETYGTRYIDILRSYGIRVNYQMLQRPEVCAIARGSINVTDVVQTASATLGDLAGHGIGASRLTLKRCVFPEHGTLMGIAVVRPTMVDSKLCDYFDKIRPPRS